MDIQGRIGSNTTQYYKSMAQSKKDVTPLLMHWSYIFLALTHRYYSIAITEVEQKKDFKLKSDGDLRSVYFGRKITHTTMGLHCTVKPLI